MVGQVMQQLALHRDGKVAIMRMEQAGLVDHHSHLTNSGPLRHLLQSFTMSVGKSHRLLDNGWPTTAGRTPKETALLRRMDAVDTVAAMPVGRREEMPTGLLLCRKMIV